jgi:DNA-directed RNA polymerase specialized sigma24 family protein
MSPGNAGGWRPRPDEEALVRFIQQHYDDWLQFLTQRFRVPQTDAEILLDRVVHEQLAPDPTFDPTRAEANGYVRQQLWWRATEYRRSPKSRTARGLGSGGDDDRGRAVSDRREPPPPLAAMTEEQRRRAWGAVCALENERHRFALICRYWVGMNAARIAGLCNARVPFPVEGVVTEGAVNMWLHYGRKELRGQLGDPPPE